VAEYWRDRFCEVCKKVRRFARVDVDRNGQPNAWGCECGARASARLMGALDHAERDNAPATWAGYPMTWGDEG
jgi:hypothetical protein